MKSLTVLIVAMLSSTAAFAELSPANRAERKMLCAAVQALTEEMGTDFALDTASCLKTKMTSELISEGARIVLGTLKFNYPSGYSQNIQCNAVYLGQPKLENIVGGITAGVDCH